jgi:hypothetical protein
MKDSETRIEISLVLQYEQGQLHVLLTLVGSGYIYVNGILLYQL